MHREHEKRQIGLFGFHQFDQFDAVRSRQGNVQQGNVRLERSHCVESGRCRGRLTAHDEIRLGIDERGDAVAKDRMIIDDQDALLERFGRVVFFDSCLVGAHDRVRKRAGNVRPNPALKLDAKLAVDGLCTIAQGL